MNPLRVSADATAIRSGAIAPVVASLPVSLTNAGTDTPASELVAVDGALGWPQRTRDALGNGTQGLMLIQPCPVTADEVPQTPSVPVVVDYRFAGNPAVLTFAGHFDGWPVEALVEVSSLVSDQGDLHRHLLDQLATARRLGLPLTDLQPLAWGPSGYYLRGSTGLGVPVLLSAHVTSAAPACLRVRGLAPDLAIELSVPDPSTARPAVLVTTTSGGALTEPTVWESAHRAAWRRLHAAAVGALPVTDLDDLRADLTVANHVLPPPDNRPSKALHETSPRKDPS